MIALKLSENKLSNVVAGVIAGAVTLTYSVTYAALIFSGDLSVFFEAGLNTALISASLIALMVSLRSSLPFAIAGPDSNASVFVAVMAAGISSEFSRHYSQGEVLPTILVAIAISSTFTGLILYGIGRLKLGYLVRFIPYPVLGGFLAGTGWLICIGSFKVMTGLPLTPSTVLSFFTWESLAHWAPGLLLATILFLILRRYKHFLIFPALLLGGNRGNPPDFAFMWTVGGGRLG